MQTKERPLNFGPLKDANGNARVTDAHGDTMEFWVKVDNRIVTAASFITDGCDDAVRCGSVAASIIQGKAPCVASAITKEQLLQDTGLPKDCERYANLVITTIKQAVDNFKELHKPTCPGSSTCRDSEKKAEASTCKSSCGTSNHGGATCGSSCSANKSEESANPKNRLPNIKHKIAVLSGKGGVGKSTVATNLSFTLASLGYKVGLLDADIHGPSIPTMLNLSNTPIDVDSEGIIPVSVGTLKVVSIGLFLRNSAEALIWRGPVKIGVINQLLYEVKWGELDFLIIDLPPGTGDEPLSIGQAFSSKDGAVIVTTPQEVASSDVRKSITFCQIMKMPIIGIIENMSLFTCAHCNTTTHIFGAHGGQKLANSFGLTLLGELPIDPNIGVSGDQGVPYVDAYATSPTAIAFKQIVGSILRAIDA